MPLTLMPSNAVDGPVRRHAQLSHQLQASGPLLVLATLLPALVRLDATAPADAPRALIACPLALFLGLPLLIPHNDIMDYLWAMYLVGPARLGEALETALSRFSGAGPVHVSVLRARLIAYADALRGESAASLLLFTVGDADLIVLGGAADDALSLVAEPLGTNPPGVHALPALAPDWVGRLRIGGLIRA